MFKSYQQRVLRLLHDGAQRLVVDGLDPQYWKGQVRPRCMLMSRCMPSRCMSTRAHADCDDGVQGHATLGAVDVCLLLSCSECDGNVEELVRRVTSRGRESASFAEARVRKHFSDSARAWAIVNALPQRLRGITVEVDGMQVELVFKTDVSPVGVLLPVCLCFSTTDLIIAPQARDVVLQRVEHALQPHLQLPHHGHVLPSLTSHHHSHTQASSHKRSRSPAPRGGGDYTSSSSVCFSSKL